MVLPGLVLISGALIVLCVVCSVKSARKKDYGSSDDAWGLGICAVMLGIILFIVSLIWLFTYTGNVSRVGELKAFREVNVQNYSITHSETKAILSSEQFANKIIAGSLEKTGTSQAISDRMKEWRDAVNAYNIEIAGKQKTRNLWLWPGWLVMPKEVMDLRLLTIQ